ncbi:hypothetical protein BTO11_01215 [Psychrosphaera saromensis]|uniref:Outer membrane protein beta-barrel domain-containing protein n=2 Tax=Psychrosphaera saromensis TaxID=716813 RepID=A0A2S7UQY3_9GAMM|nr:hypothetical protein BTO11_01215 [Psychrosphaera saromensis]
MKKILIILHLVLLHFSATSYSTESYQLRLDTGVNIYASRFFENLKQDLPGYDSFNLDPYIGIAAYKYVSPNNKLGSRIDIQEINQHTLISVRAIDYQFAISESFMTNVYLGAARYQFRTPAYGYALGFGLLYHPQNWGNWGVQLEGRYFDALARDKLTDADPQGGDFGPDSFHDIQSLSIGLNYYF